ncbi:MAG: polysaccharide deacetylase family protein [Promethearchaeota archaeon]|jgi:hypothetical protein
MKIALTFDIERDIPNVLNTYLGVKVGLVKILELLDEYNIKGTFFCTGNVAKAYSEYIKLIERKNHEIACHSLNHERLSRLNFRECHNSIYQNKKILQNICPNSNILSFRAPYLSPPKNLFGILNSLGFSYDSSFKFRHRMQINKITTNQIREFHPLNLNLRFPFYHSFFKKLIFKQEVTVLYFHPVEAINMKKLISSQINNLHLFKDFVIRPDRWVNTGNIFISKIRHFIDETLSMKADFVTINKLSVER